MVTSAFSLDSKLVTKTKELLHFGEAAGDSLVSHIHSGEQFMVKKTKKQTNKQLL